VNDSDKKAIAAEMLDPAYTGSHCRGNEDGFSFEIWNSKHKIGEYTKLPELCAVLDPIGDEQMFVELWRHDWESSSQFVFKDSSGALVLTDRVPRV
jgi:hypothetical protein